MKLMVCFFRTLKKKTKQQHEDLFIFSLLTFVNGSF